MIYRVHYVKEVKGAATVYGSFDMTQEHVEVVHCGSVMTALLDSDLSLDSTCITDVERLAS